MAGGQVPRGMLGHSQHAAQESQLALGAPCFVLWGAFGFLPTARSTGAQAGAEPGEKVNLPRWPGTASRHGGPG